MITSKRKPKRAVSIIEIVDYIGCKETGGFSMLYRYRIIIIQETSILR